MYITIKIAENISLRANDALQFPLTREALLNSINTFNVNTLQEMEKVAMHDFGIFLELEPDEEEKAKLEQNIQVALQGGGIDLDDAIDIREVSNIKLANQLLKLKRKEKQADAQAAQQANIQAQAQANAQASEAAAMAEVQKQQALAETKVQIEKAKSDFEIARMEQEALIKKQLMAEEFNYNIQLAQAQASATTEKEQEIQSLGEQIANHQQAKTKLFIKSQLTAVQRQIDSKADKLQEILNADMKSLNRTITGFKQNIKQIEALKKINIKETKTALKTRIKQIKDEMPTPVSHMEPEEFQDFIQGKENKERGYYISLGMELSRAEYELERLDERQVPPSEDLEIALADAQSTMDYLQKKQK